MLSIRPLALALTVSVLLPACGHKGPPIAPRRRTPPSLGDLRLAQRGESLEVRLTAPTASVDGVAYDEVEIEIFWGEGQVDLEKAGRRRTVRATAGSRVVETLSLPAPDTLVRVAARAAVGRARGQRSLILALEAQSPLAPPHGLDVALREAGVVLGWQGEMPEPVDPPDLAAPGGFRMPFSEAPAGSPTAGAPGGDASESGAPPPAEPERDELEATGAQSAAPEETPAASGAGGGVSEEPPPPPPHGFRVYRRVSPGTYQAPLNHQPQEERAYTDPAAPLGAQVCYVVRAVGSVDPLIESAPSNEACLDVRDIVAPAPPTGLAVVPRDGGLEIVWSPSRESDLGGYRIYRAVGENEAERVGEVEAGVTSWLDDSTEAVVLYRYSVTAFDRAGNESEASNVAEGRRP